MRFSFPQSTYVVCCQNSSTFQNSWPRPFFEVIINCFIPILLISSTVQSEIFFNSNFSFRKPHLDGSDRPLWYDVFTKKKKKREKNLYENLKNRQARYSKCLKISGVILGKIRFLFSKSLTVKRWFLLIPAWRHSAFSGVLLLKAF